MSHSRRAHAPARAQARAKSHTGEKWKGRKFPRNLQCCFILHGRVWKKRWSCSDMHPTDLRRSYEQEVSSSVFTGTKHVKKSGQPKATCVQWSESLKTLVLASTWHVDAAFTNTHKCNGFLCDLNCWTHPIQCSNMDNQLIMSHNTINRTQTHLLSCYYILAKENAALVNAYMH